MIRLYALNKSLPSCELQLRHRYKRPKPPAVALLSNNTQTLGNGQTIFGYLTTLLGVAFKEVINISL
jgi:hypothetical protein